ncbi:MAG: inositol monophosphatase [Deltaproteobacteria bacterium]|nr:inositol monophosphatase [Deltaproteobacteria bacterium]
MEASGGATVDLQALLGIAREAVTAAAELLANARPSSIRTKSNPRDLVTEWDVRSEQTIREVLQKHTAFTILGEEGGEVAGDVARADVARDLRWVVDPIDGTVNFAHGLPLWAIALSCERGVTRTDGPTETLVGVVAVPALGWWFEGTLGGGATCNGEPMKVSAIGRLEQALLATGFPYDRATNPLNNFAEWEYFQRKAGACRRLGAASIDLCLVARGALDGYWERHLKAWDIAAGALFVTEAGGTVTNTRGAPLDPHQGTVVASNGAIHDELITGLRDVRPKSEEPV